MKNLKLATKISLIAAIILVIGLSFLCLAMNRGVSTIMRNSELEDMNAMLDAREEIVNQYVASAEAYLIGFGQAPQLKVALQKPNDTGIIGDAQVYTEGYAAVNAQLENIYLANYDTTVLTSFVTGAIGKTLREGDSREQLRKDIFSGNSVFNAGIMTSKSTGMQVISMNCPIYDGDKPLGYVGGAIYAEGLRNVLKELDAKSGGSNEFLLLDAATNSYIFCDTDESIGTPIEDENVLNIIQSAVGSADGSGNVEYRTDGKDMLAVYSYMPERNWVIVTVANSDIAFADIRIMSSQLATMCLIIGIVIAITIWLMTRYLAKDITKIAGIIGEIATLDLTLKNKLDVFTGRKDEVGAIADATQTLTDAVSNTVKTIQDESKRLADVSSTLVEDVTSSTESIDNMEDAIHEIAESATQQAADTQKAAKNVVGIGNKIKTTMEETDHLYEYADTIQKTGQELLNTVKALAQANDSTKQAIEDIGVQTVSTNESAIKIKDAAQLITSIAEETNLLSLNASIEAARAGEQGRGFAVVASQIQKLAEQSNDSARFIDNIINTLLTDSEKAVESMNEMRSVVMEQVKQLEYTEVQFEQMYQNIGITKDGVNNIHVTIQDMDKDRADVVGAVESLSDIAEGNAATTEETLASTELVASTIKNISDMATQLASIVKIMDENIANFIITK